MILVPTTIESDRKEVAELAIDMGISQYDAACESVLAMAEVAQHLIRGLSPDDAIDSAAIAAAARWDAMSR